MKSIDIIFDIIRNKSEYKFFNELKLFTLSVD